MENGVAPNNTSAKGVDNRFLTYKRLVHDSEDDTINEINDIFIKHGLSSTLPIDDELDSYDLLLNHDVQLKKKIAKADIWTINTPGCLDKICTDLHEQDVSEMNFVP